MKVVQRTSAAVALIALFLACRVSAEAAPYTFSDIPNPPRMEGKVGGVDFTPSGKLAACFHRGDLWLYSPNDGTWKQFAEGLQEPLGLVAISDSEFLVVQRPELTRLVDEDGDGWADLYRTVCDDFGMSGNYHEFAFGPAVGPDGDWFISLNTASNGAGIYDEVRGEFREIGRPGRMYACVPYRGWTLRVDADGSMEPWAMGFRSPNGIGFDHSGRLFVTDNQGDWLGTSKVYHVEKDQFYGHVTSLVWKEGVTESPLKWDVERLDAMRRKASFLLPHGELSNSPTQPIPFPEDGSFGPFEGQLIIGEMNYPHLIRAMPDVVHGNVQGAVTKFLGDTEMRRGAHRFTWGPDGALWLGHTFRARGWIGDKGLQRVAWTGETPTEVQWMRLTEDGFELTFTRPMDREALAKAETYQFTRFYYEYHQAYGSNRFDVASVSVTEIEVSADGKTVGLTLPEQLPGYVYKLTLDGLSDENGAPVLNPNLYYTLNYRFDGTTGTPQFSQK